jgi:hypothetical protein
LIVRIPIGIGVNLVVEMVSMAVKIRA